MTTAIDVEVYVFERDSSNRNFTQTKTGNYTTTVNENKSFELPVVVVEKDSAGNTLKYVACNVKPTVAPINEDRMKKPKRSVVAKKAKSVTAPAPDPERNPSRPRRSRNEENHLVVVSPDVPAIKTKKPNPERKLSGVFNEEAFRAAIERYL